MRSVQPKCYHACGRKAAVGRLFCSTKCAAEWAEELARGNEDEWCVPCQAWQSASVTTTNKLGCGHMRVGLLEGMKHADASKKYGDAIGGQIAHWGEERFTSEETRKDEL